MAALTDPLLTAADAPSAPFVATVVPRDGKPELTFFGRPLADLQTGPRGDDAAKGSGAAIAIWVRQDGQFVLAWTTATGGRITRCATVLVSLADVMDHIEECCRALASDVPVWRQPPCDTRAALTAYLAQVTEAARFRHDFEAAAGEALALCDSICPDH